MQLIDNRCDEETLAEHLRRSFASATTAFIHVAYLRASGVRLVREAVQDFVERGGRLRVLAGGDFAQTEPEALQVFRALGGDAQVKLVSSSGIGGFHPKCYLFYHGEQATLIVGSSNFTDGGLAQNIELNLRADRPAEDPTVVNARAIFDHLWNATPPLTEERLADYRRYWEECHSPAGGFIYRLPPEEGKSTMSETTEPNREVQIGDTVSVNGQIGQVVSVNRLGERLSVGVAMEGVGLRTILSPPTGLRVVDTPLSRVKKMDFDPPALFDLLTEATRLSLAYEHDRLVSLSNSRARLEPYQVAAVHQVISAWEQRFLIADDVGLGKTVEAGMMMKELAARHRADKVLIIAPAGLVLQWRREMREKFDEVFEPFDSSRLRQWRSIRPAGETLSVRYPRVVVSLDTAKPREDENNAPDFTEAHWDLVILDEAHKVEQHGMGEELISRYKLARDLAPSCDSLLLLSATPHDGDPYAFHSLVELIDPYRFPHPEQITPDDLEPVMVRRSKADLRKEDGRLLFPPRWVETTEVTFTKEELRLYQQVTDYVRDGYRAATGLKDTAVGFLMVLLQKRMVSSIAAIRRSLERRLIALEHPEAAILTPAELRDLKEREEDEESLPEERQEQLQRKLEKARLRLSDPEHQREIRRVRDLLELAKRIRVDSKAQELRKFVRGVLDQSPDEKILIFTEYTDTLDYLRDEVLKGFGPIAQIYGSMNPEQRQEQEEYFQHPEVHLMLATDAAGEGINLQFCHLMVNYELPWNPNRIEQRIGRLHRYGQEREVRVYNLQVVNTREGIVRIRTPRPLLDGKAILEEYPQATFDKGTAFRHKPQEVQFIAFGHPLLDAIIRHCRDRSGGPRGAVCVKRVSQVRLGARSGLLFHYTLRYADSYDQTLREELLPVFVSVDGKVSLERGRALGQEAGKERPDPPVDDRVAELVTLVDDLERLAQQAAAEESEAGYQRLQAERHRQANACVESLQRFRDAKRQRLQLSIRDYQKRLTAGEDMDIAIRRAQHELERLDEECDRRAGEIESKRHVQAHTPELLNVALLIASP